jgi:hypothetical protein
VLRLLLVAAVAPKMRIFSGIKKRGPRWEGPIPNLDNLDQSQGKSHMNALASALKSFRDSSTSFRSSSSVATKSPAGSFNWSRTHSHEEDGSELAEFQGSFRSDDWNGHEASTRPVNEVAMRLEEIDQRLQKEHEQREREAAEERGLLKMSLTAGDHDKSDHGFHGHNTSGDCDRQSHDTASNIERPSIDRQSMLSTADTSEGFWDLQEREVMDRESRPLMITHVVEPDDTIGGICVK